MKLSVTNANFCFGCRDKSQNKSLRLIYDENAEVEFISKHSKYDTRNFFLSQRKDKKYRRVLQ